MKLACITSKIQASRGLSQHPLSWRRKCTSWRILQFRPILPKFRLDYVDGASDHSKVFCMLVKEEFLAKKENGPGIILGVNSVKNHQAVYSLDDEQSWFLKQTAAGYMIGQVSDGIEYTWYIGNKGEPIVIVADGSLETQSWKFVPAK